VASRSAHHLSPPRPDGRTPRIQEKRSRRRDEILHAALRAFRDRGYHATTLDDIAEHLGVRKTALYHYFPDKQSILFECHRESLAELDRIMREAEELDSASEKLAHVVREHVRVMTDTLEGSPLAFEVTSLSPEQRAPLIAGRDRYERWLREVIDEAMQNGEFRRGDPKIAVFVVLGAINWIARWYRPEGEFHAAELGNEFVETLLGGLETRPRSVARSAATRARERSA
jgi:AcrR family transcriptional regulator